MNEKKLNPECKIVVRHNITRDENIYRLISFNYRFKYIWLIIQSKNPYSKSVPNKCGGNKNTYNNNNSLPENIAFHVIFLILQYKRINNFLFVFIIYLYWSNMLLEWLDWPLNSIKATVSRLIILVNLLKFYSIVC